MPCIVMRYDLLQLIKKYYKRYNVCHDVHLQYSHCFLACSHLICHLISFEDLDIHSLNKSIYHCMFTYFMLLILYFCDLIFDMPEKEKS